MIYKCNTCGEEVKEVTRGVIEPCKCMRDKIARKKTIVDETICGKCGVSLKDKASFMSPTLKKDERYLCTKCGLEKMRFEITDEGLKELLRLKDEIVSRGCVCCKEEKK